MKIFFLRPHHRPVIILFVISSETQPSGLCVARSVICLRASASAFWSRHIAGPHEFAERLSREFTEPRALPANAQVRLSVSARQDI